MQRRQRLRLSCNECYGKKLSCNRARPCSRCLRAGRSSLCRYDTESGEPPIPTQSQLDDIASLKAENDRLRRELSRQVIASQQQGGKIANRDESHAIVASLLNNELVQQSQADHRQHESNGIIHPSSRSPSGYWRRHCLMSLFQDTPNLFDFIIEIDELWLRPRGISLKKIDSFSRSKRQTNVTPILPPADELNLLIDIYLSSIETYNLLGPGFRQQYSTWSRQDNDPFTFLIYATLTCAVCTSSAIAKKYRPNLVAWLKTCETWLKDRSPKKRTILDYQISCLVFLAKRMNQVNRKAFTIETGRLIQLALLDDLHVNAQHSPEHRRIWRALQEMDLQNSFEFGMPSLLHNLDNDCILQPSLFDSSFDMHLAMTYGMRLEISRRLFSPTLSSKLSYEEILNYTQRLSDTANQIDGTTLSTSCFVLLQCQLKEAALALHRQYIRSDMRRPLSELISYQTAHEMLALQIEANDDVGIHLREDLLNAALTITLLSLLQPKDSSSIIRSGCQSSIDLLTQCLPLVESRYDNSFRKEPWCLLSLSGPIMLLRIHAGMLEKSEAQRLCAEAFVEVYQNTQPSLQPSQPVDDQLQSPIDLDAFMDMDSIFDGIWTGYS